MLVDSHVNLHSEKYDEDRAEVIRAAREAGIGFMLTISDKLSSQHALEALTREYPNMARSVGVHPHYANEHPDLSAEQLVELARAGDVIGIGECGLDFYYEYSDRKAQLPVFAAHIEAAQETALPLIIHTRDADELMRQTLEDAHVKKAFTPLLHCYTGGPDLARAALNMGGYISFSGILTFKNANDIREIAEWAPLERIIIETDCPYLAPMPLRGRRCDPAMLVHIAQKLADIRNLSRTEIDEITTDNFFRLFSKAVRPTGLNNE